MCIKSSCHCQRAGGDRDGFGPSDFLAGLATIATATTTIMDPDDWAIVLTSVVLRNVFNRYLIKLLGRFICLVEPTPLS